MSNSTPVRQCLAGLFVVVLYVLSNYGRAFPVTYRIHVSPTQVVNRADAVLRKSQGKIRCCGFFGTQISSSPTVAGKLLLCGQLTHHATHISRHCWVLSRQQVQALIDGLCVTSPELINISSVVPIVANLPRAESTRLVQINTSSKLNLGDLLGGQVVLGNQRLGVWGPCQK